MSREFCRDVPDPWGCSKSLCKKSSCAFFVPYNRSPAFLVLRIDLSVCHLPPIVLWSLVQKYWQGTAFCFNRFGQSLSNLKIFKAGSLQCGFWPRNSQIPIWILLWIFGWSLSSCFFQGKGFEKIYQKIPPQNSPGSLFRKIPLGFLQAPFFERFCRFDWVMVSQQMIQNVRALPMVGDSFARCHIGLPFSPQDRSVIIDNIVVNKLRFVRHSDQGEKSGTSCVSAPRGASEPWPHHRSLKPQNLFLFRVRKKSEEDKRATTNVQNGLVFFFLFSFILFYYLCTKTAVKPLNSQKKSWRKNSEKLWKSVKKCGKVPKSVKKCRDDFAL